MSLKKPFTFQLIVLVVLGPFALKVVEADEQQAKNNANGFSASQIEHFEKNIRPLLSKRCFQCHSQNAKRLEGGLYLDSRAGMLEGGDTGPSLVPGKASESLLVDAIGYEGDYLMPPRGKLPDAEIKLLTEWVNDGAPWPTEESSGPARARFDLEDRKRTHWCWQPVKKVTPPAVQDERWAQSAIDRFLYSAMKREGLSPAPRADRAVWLRRVYLTLNGLPPTPEEVTAYLDDRSDEADERVVDRLLSSPKFGERWARHWLDLMRYAESRGHEFDYDTPNAYQYRDYVIRALNRDVPYNQFVLEHIAGDLLENPRMSEDGQFDEAILGTGFWHLGEWVHSPVDIRKDEADRHDNMVDVFGKAFLGLTIACARCHDHKFDAISQRDYYAMSGFLQSSEYRLARFDSLRHNLEIAEQLEEVRTRTRRQLMDRLQPKLQEGLTGKQSLVHYLSAAREVLQTPRSTPPAEMADLVIEDFESGDYEGWSIQGDAFGKKPHTQATLPDYQGNVGAKGQFFVNSHSVAEGASNQRGDQLVGRMTSSEFKIERQFIHFLVGGGSHKDRTCVNLLVGGKVVATATGKNDNRMASNSWDVSQYRGKLAKIEIVDQERGGWGNIGLDHIVQTNTVHNGATSAVPDISQLRDVISTVSGRRQLDADRLERVLRHLVSVGQSKSDLLGPWADWSQTAGGSSQFESRLNQSIRARDLTQAGEQGTVEFKIETDYSRPEAQPWLVDGPTFGLRPASSGDLILGVAADSLLQGVTVVGQARRDPAFLNLKNAPGSAKDAGRLNGLHKAGRTIRTPTFELTDGRLHYLVSGSGHALVVIDSHRMLNGPLHGSVLRKFEYKDSLNHWVSQDLRRYKGHRVHVEFTPVGEGQFQILKVGQGERPPADPGDLARRNVFQFANSREVNNEQAFLSALETTLRSGIDAFGDPDASESQLVVGDWLARNADLMLEGKSREDWIQTKQSLAEPLAGLASEVQHESRLAIAMWDGTGEDERVMIRGNHMKPGDVASRRLPEALVGDRAVQESGSGRMTIARQVIDPANPLTTRVIVNRLWHHVFGRGIVPTVDNFGVLGEKPSHPELLDHLATQFVEDGWSIKSTLKQLVLSEAFHMSSEPARDAEVSDPGNIWLHRMPVVRLEGEVIRDSMLAISGRLDARMFGPPVPVYVDEFMEGRGRPRSGPLDGNGRRSIYTSIRRNFLPSMMLAFDMPQPFSSMGRRTVSNVPAQALILMNDPFVIQQAQLWSRRLIESNTSDAARMRQAYQEAFAREATAVEIKAGLEFLDMQSQEYGGSDARDKAWADWCHVLFNVKEFIFIP